jgi:hypothetical protein
MQQSPRPGRFILVKESASSGLRAAKMNDNLFYRHMQSVALLREDNDTISFVLYVRAITMLGNAMQVASSKPTWRS